MADDTRCNLTKRTKITVNIWHDEHAEDPCGSGWTLHSFGRSHYNSTTPEEVGIVFDDATETWRPSAALAKKIEEGSAYFLDYYEHGCSYWYLPGEAPNCRWDTSRMAGLLVWEDDTPLAATYDENRSYADTFLQDYNQWANGNVFGFTATATRPCCECGQDRPDDSLDEDPLSQGGYYGERIADLVHDLVDMMPEGDFEVVFTDDHGGYLADACKETWENIGAERE